MNERTVLETGMKNFGICLATLSMAVIGSLRLFAADETMLADGWEFRREGGDWQKVTVPHDWAIAGPFDKNIDMQVVAIVENGEKKPAEKTGRSGSLPWIGKGEYRRTVEIPDGKSFASLVFDGAMSEPEVFCDGKKVGEWKNGYNAFEVTLPANAGKHEILVKLTNRPLSTRWYPGAGLIRPVKLVLGGETGVKTWGNAIWTPDLKTVRIKTECRGKPGKIVYRIMDGTREVAVSEKDVITGSFEPWSPENPKLYTLVTEVYDEKGAIADRRTDRFGVRTLEYGKRGFLLNGKARKFKGVCMHHDLGPFGAVFDRDAFIRQMMLLREMGCDSLRTSHNMPAEGQLEVCDELGIMVMAESFDSWGLAKVQNGYNLFFNDWWRRDLENLVRKGRNHPSVVMWSIGNEVYDQREKYAPDTIRDMQALIHSFDPDPGRKVTQGLSWMPEAIISGANAAMEIPAVTYRLPFYEAMYTNSSAGFVLGAETASTVSSRGVYHFPVKVYDEKMHPDLQCSSYDVEYAPWSNLPDDDWAMQEDHPWTIGEFVWTGFDYLGEPYPYDEVWPSRSSYFGIFDLAGIPKDRYWLYRSHWNETSHTLHLLPHWTFPDRVGKVTPVYCYTDFDEAELFVNGKSQGRRRKDKSSRLDRFRLRWNDVVYAPGELKVVAYDKTGKAVMTEVVRTAGAPAKVELAKRRFGKYLFVTASVVDSNGVLVPDADPELSFSCGNGLRFKAICNGDATSVESFVVPHMRAFHGQLVAVFEGDGEDVSVTMRAIAAERASFDISKFGASPKNTPAANAAAIHKAIDAAAAVRGRVIVPAGEWVSGTIWLKGGIDFHLAKGAVLKASPDLKDYNALDAYPENFGCEKTEYWKGHHFIICRATEDVSITGEGTIHGNGDVFFDEKPVRYYDWMTPNAKAWWNGIRWSKDKVNLRPGQLIVFVKCSNVRVEGITIRNSPCWSLFFYGCQDVAVRKYTVRNGHDDGNTDGVDVDCCRDVILEDLDIDTGDDAIAIRAAGNRLGVEPQPPCENVTVRRAKLKSTSSVFRIGVGDGLIRNVVVEDVKSERGGTAVNLNACYGSVEKGGVDMENIVFRRCRFDNCREAYSIHSAGKKQKFGIRNVTFEDVMFPKGVPRHIGADNGSPQPQNVLFCDAEE